MEGPFFSQNKEFGADISFARERRTRLLLSERTLVPEPFFTPINAGEIQISIFIVSVPVKGFWTMS